MGSALGTASRLMSFAPMRVVLATFISGSFLAAQSGGAIAETVLTLSRGPQDVETLDLTLEDLLHLRQVAIVTSNAFHDGPAEYRGPLARDVIELLALNEAEVLRFTAANDYYVDLPTSDLLDYDVVLATEAEGVRLSRRDKGPLWLMYPISDHPELAEEHYVHRLIWQVVRIEAR